MDEWMGQPMDYWTERPCFQDAQVIESVKTALLRRNQEKSEEGGGEGGGGGNVGGGKSDEGGDDRSMMDGGVFLVPLAHSCMRPSSDLR